MLLLSCKNQFKRTQHEIKTFGSNGNVFAYLRFR